MGVWVESYPWGRRKGYLPQARFALPRWVTRGTPVAVSTQRVSPSLEAANTSYPESHHCRGLCASARCCTAGGKRQRRLLLRSHCPRSADRPARTSRFTRTVPFEVRGTFFILVLRRQAQSSVQHKR
jgi:hypothetical protein